MKILLTGGAGFIGSSVIRQALSAGDIKIVNVDTLTYAGNLDSLASIDANPDYAFEQVNICDGTAIAQVFAKHRPTVVMHLAAESHVDRSIDGPEAFLSSNVCGTFSLLQAARAHWESLPEARQEAFRFHHISTDEVFGSLGTTGRFTEDTPYDPRSPYSASKAASDHLVQAWHHTYELPVVLTNCSNNYGPWQFPEKLIPVVILKAAAGEPIPLYGDGMNIRDWLHVEDHVDALLLAACRGQSGRSYCVGGYGERTNTEVVETICQLLDELQPSRKPHQRLITPVSDRPGHDRRYAIDPNRIETELGWQPKYGFEEGLKDSVRWYLEHQDWCQKVRSKSG